MLKKARLSGKGRAAPRAWQAPVLDGKFSTAFGSSIVERLVGGYTAGSVLTELIQNEYDAGGRSVRVEFAEDMLLVRGNGRPIDSKGWKRLSVVFGTGRVAGAMSRDTIEAKQNGIGSMNLGLRSLFLFGNRIYVSSAGKQAVLDLPLVGVASATDGTTRGLPGVTIRVPYRVNPFGSFPPFSLDAEVSALEQMRSALPFSVVKLSAPQDQRHSLTEVVIRSQRLNQAISWRQSAKSLDSPAKATAVIQRSVQVRETSRSEKLQARRLPLTITEIEFQRSILLPNEDHLEQIPGYFQRPRKRIRLGLSVRLRGDKLDVTAPGIFYYPLGLPDRHTGIPVSVSAPFTLNSDRSQILEHDWNHWLMKQAAALMVELLTTDWHHRFGAQAYLLANRITVPSYPSFSEAVLAHLKKDPCWPSRAVVGRSTRPILAPANQLVVVDDKRLDGFLSAQRYLDSRLNEDETLRALAVNSGARRFTLNSAVRLKCGPAATQLATKLGEDEANFRYEPYESTLQDVKYQVQFADCFSGLWKQLTDANKKDLKESASTLTSDGTLRPARELWLIRPEISDGVTIPPESRLHPALVSSPVFIRLCQKYDVSQWALDIATRLKTPNPPSENDREALYKLLLSDPAAVNRQARATLWTAAVVRNHRGEWVEPVRLKLVRGRSAEILEPVLHFPAPELLRAPNAAKVWRFKKTIDGQDLVAFAKMVTINPQLSASFEDTLDRHKLLLTSKIVKDLAPLAFLRCTEGRIAAPNNVYLRTQETEACLGSGGLFPEGNRRKLYAILQCRTRPGTEDILSRLRALRHEGKPPEQPTALYAALREAMRRENRNVAQLAQEPVLWTTKGYAIPTLTLVGMSVPRSLRRYLPVCPDPRLEESYQALGARSAGTTEHWRHFFRMIHQKYQSGNRTVECDDKVFLLDAYSQARASEAIAADVKILLDDSDALHTQSDALAGTVVLNDVPALAQAIRQSGIPIAFAVTQLHHLASKLQLQKLSDLQGVPHAQLGTECHAPFWFQPPLGGIEKPLQSGLGDALGVVLQSRFGLAPRVAQVAQQRLGSVSNIIFVDCLTLEYPLVASPVSVNGESWLSGSAIYLVPVSSRQELYDLVADALAEGLSLGLGTDDLRTLASLLQRLLSCGSRVEMVEVLRRWGIPWDHANTLQDTESNLWSSDGDLGRDVPDATASVLEHIGHSLIVDLHDRSSIQHSTTNGEGNSKESADTDYSLDDSTTEAREPQFPDIAQVELVLQPSDGIAGATLTSGPYRGGSPDPETKRRVEAAAIEFVTAWLTSQGFTVEDRQRDNYGYDLLASSAQQNLKVEVKGTDASEPRFFLTRNEWGSRADAEWRLALVTSARSAPTLTFLTGDEVARQFSFEALTWECKPRQSSPGI